MKLMFVDIKKAHLSGKVRDDQYEYISLLAELHSLTAAFRAHDPAGSGAAHLQYATFMQIVYAARN